MLEEERVLLLLTSRLLVQLEVKLKDLSCLDFTQEV